MESSIKSEYRDSIQKVNEIYGVFKNYFGEEHVDLQDILSEPEYYIINEDSDVSKFCYILVWFPEVTVTNSYGRSTRIYDLYAKVSLDHNGCLYVNDSISFIKATYTKIQFINGYIHSHVRRLTTKSDCSRFHHPCFGLSNISSTINLLKVKYDLDAWHILCSELEDFTRIESNEGGPYISLEELGNTGTLETVYENEFRMNTMFSEEWIYSLMSSFMRWLCKNVELSFGSVGNIYTVGKSMQDNWIFLSNRFIEWYNMPDNMFRSQELNTQLFGQNILREYAYKNGEFYKTQSITDLGVPENNIVVCIFKGEEIKLNVIYDPIESAHTVILLDPNITNAIIYSIFKVINVNSNKKNNETDRKTFYI